jgi:hypothetical protein
MRHDLFLGDAPGSEKRQRNNTEEHRPRRLKRPKKQQQQQQLRRKQQPVLARLNDTFAESLDTSCYGKSRAGKASIKPPLVANATSSKLVRLDPMIYGPFDAAASGSHGQYIIISARP